MQNISVYLNYRASNTSVNYWKESIERSLFRSHLKFYTPENLDHLNDCLTQDLRAEVDCVVSVGGDGTVNTITQRLAKQDKIGLLVIPGGTANDFARELGHYTKKHNDVLEVFQSIRQNNISHIDLIDINGRYMVTNGGIGLGGLVTDRINNLRKKIPLFKNMMKLSGKNTYAFFIATELLSYNFSLHRLKIEAAEFSDIVETGIMLVNNQSSLAGTLKVAPHTRNNDGYFNVAFLKHKSRANLIRCIAQVLMGYIPDNDPNFVSFETNQLKITNLDADKKIDFFGDGEVFKECSHMRDEAGLQYWDIKVVKNGLKVYQKKSFEIKAITDTITLQ